MRIGIIRHFKVNCYKKPFMTSKEFKEWEKNYNESDVTRNDVELMEIKWNKCYSSTLIRAVETAKDVYKGEIIKTNLIRETVIDPIFESNLKLPYWFWAVSARLAWYFNHNSQEESKTSTRKKAREFVDLIENESMNDSLENILIVTHGFFMYTLQKELKSRGFKGKIVRTPKNGTLYLYVR